MRAVHAGHGGVPFARGRAIGRFGGPHIGAARFLTVYIPYCHALAARIGGHLRAMRGSVGPWLAIARTWRGAHHSFGPQRAGHSETFGLGCARAARLELPIPASDQLVSGPR